MMPATTISSTSRQPTETPANSKRKRARGPPGRPLRGTRPARTPTRRRRAARAGACGWDPFGLRLDDGRPRWSDLAPRRRERCRAVQCRGPDGRDVCAGPAALRGPRTARRRSATAAARAAPPRPAPRGRRTGRGGRHGVGAARGADGAAGAGRGGGRVGRRVGRGGHRIGRRRWRRVGGPSACESAGPAGTSAPTRMATNRTAAGSARRCIGP